MYTCITFDADVNIFHFSCALLALELDLGADSQVDSQTAAVNYLLPMEENLPPIRGHTGQKNLSKLY
jgi:hypothetical protein